MADSNKLNFFFFPSILNIFSWKFHGLVLGSVGWIDVKGIGVAQPIWLRLSDIRSKRGWKHKKGIFCLFLSKLITIATFKWNISCIFLSVRVNKKKIQLASAYFGSPRISYDEPSLSKLSSSLCSDCSNGSYMLAKD